LVFGQLENRGSFRFAGFLLISIALSRAIIAATDHTTAIVGDQHTTMPLGDHPAAATTIVIVILGLSRCARDKRADGKHEQCCKTQDKAFQFPLPSVRA